MKRTPSLWRKMVVKRRVRAVSMKDRDTLKHPTKLLLMCLLWRNTRAQLRRHFQPKPSRMVGMDTFMVFDSEVLYGQSTMMETLLLKGD